jgi:GntR family transcriptional regulator, carbon starvation induced regulator
LPTESELLLQSEFAAERLRSDIVSGAWSPGTKLKMRELLPRYDVGASPMREALARLAAEGFVEQRAQRGMRVPELNFEELQDTESPLCLLKAE